MTVALVGTLQSELGCAADWTPDCAATELLLGEDGIWSAEFDVPAPADGKPYEYKLAMNDDWAGSYPDKNVPLMVAGTSRIRFSYDPEGKEPKLRLEPLNLAGPYSGSAGDDAIVVPPVRQAGGDERFYFVMTDRFANGDTTNDRGGSTSTDRLVTGFDPTDKGFYHGGDLRGLINNLDYIQELGTTAIWLTPSFKNRPVQGVGETASAGYHGYWITDFTQIDPHLGTNAELDELIAAAEERGIDLFFDIITNHTADVISYEENTYSYVDQKTSPTVDADGEPILMENAARLPADQFPTLTKESFPYTPVFAPADADLKVPAIFNDVTLYHNRGDSTYAGESTTLGDFSGLDDLMTENPKVVDAFVEVYQHWMDMGVDGFRIDTAKHVNFEFWEQWTAAIADHAAATGNDEFFTFGEVYSSDPAVLAPYIRDTDMSSVLDFGFQEFTTAYSRGGKADQFGRVFDNDDMYVTPYSSQYALPTFLGNHDMGRINFFLRDKQGPLERSQLAHSLMYLMRGQPVVYYGDEQGFVGSGGDKDARQDMFATQVEQYAAEKMITGEASGKKDRFDQDAPLYEHIANLSTVREAHPALNQGAQVELLADGGTYAFSRVGEPEPGLVTSVPTRAVDNRAVAPGAPRCVEIAGFHGVPEMATGVAINVTAVSPTGPGYAVVYPDTKNGTTPMPETSTVNFEPGKDVANSTTVALPENGKLCYQTKGAARAGVLIDVTGYTLPGSGVELQSPERVLDTRSPEFDPDGPVQRGKEYEVQVAGFGGVPEDATSVLLNVTVTGVTAPGNLQVYSGGTTRPGTSTVNYAPGQDKANSTVVELTDEGTVAFWSETVAGTSTNPVQVIMDVLGWTTADSPLTGASPDRLVDTRTNVGLQGALKAGTPVSLDINANADIPAGATAVVLNVTAVEPQGVGNLRVYPGAEGAGTPVPGASTVNYIAGRAIPNQVIVALPENGMVNLYSDGSATDVVVDLVGYVGGQLDGGLAEYVVVSNSSDAETTAEFRTLTPNGRYTGVWGTDAALSAAADGTVSVTVPARTALAFQGSKPVAAAAELSVEMTAPAPGAGLKGLVPVRATTPENVYVETSFAVRPVGGTEWTSLGTSDNGNNRVFHDVSGYAPGTLLEYRAVTVDVDGAKAADSTYASVGNPVQYVEPTGSNAEPEPQPDPTFNPAVVSVAGSVNSEMGCVKVGAGTDNGDWEPACPEARLTEGTEGVWSKTFLLPGGSYAWKIATDNTWDVNYGANGVPNGGNITLTVPGDATTTTEVTFYFDELTRYAFARVAGDPDVVQPGQHDAMSVAGSFQNQVGCSDIWSDQCRETLMTDLNGDGIFRYTTRALAAGTWEAKIVHNFGWTESYGAGGGDGNISVTVPEGGGLVEFLYDPATHLTEVRVLP